MGRNTEAAEIFVGRERELAELQGATGAAMSGRGALLLVSGEPGIGKTRLGWEGIEHARHLGSRPVYASAWEGDGAPAYWLWRQVLRQLAHAESGEAPVPELAPDSGVWRGRDAAAARFELFDQVADYLAAIAALTPLVLVLDDLQWADVSSLLLLQFLGARLPSLPVLVVGTYRAMEVVGADRVEILAALDRAALRITLGGLSAAETEQFVAAAAGADASPTLVAALHRRSGGNPLFAREMVRLLGAQGVDTARAAETAVPATVAEVIERRLARLPQQVTDLLITAAVVGESTSLQVLEAATGHPLAELTGLLEPARRAGLLEQRLDDAGTVAFAHALVRETLYVNLGPAGRAERHARVGLGLETLPGTDPAELAHHFLRAGPATPRTRTVRYAVRAGRDALDALAHEQAAEWFQRARDAAGDDIEAYVEACLGRAEARRRAGDLTGARDDLHVVLSAAHRHELPAALARAALGIHLLGEESGAPRDEPISVLEGARAALPDSEADVKARVLASLAREHRRLPDGGGRADELSASALDLARQAGTPETLARCLLARHDAVWAPGTAEDRLALAEEMEGAAQRSADVELRAEAVLLQATALLELCDPAALARLDRFIRLADRASQPRMSYLALSRRAMRATLQGEFTTARACMDEAAAVATRGHEPDAEGVSVNLEWALATLTGRRAELADRLPDPATRWPALLAWRALALHAAGRPDEARRALARAAGTRWHREPDRLWGAQHLPPLAEAAVALDDGGLADECYQALLPLSGSACLVAAAVAFDGAADHHLGRLALTLGRPAAAVAHLEEAVALHDQLGARPWAALSRLWLARAALVQDRAAGRRRAIDLAQGASEIADELGMDQLAADATSLLATREREGTLRHTGTAWTLAWGGHTTAVPDVKGLRDLAALLSHPGEDIAATDLYVTGTGLPAPAGGEFDPVLDRRAVNDYKRRLSVLADEIDQAESTHDLGQAQRARDEREAILGELRRATGLGGRQRHLGDGAERARKAVTARVRDAIARIETKDPLLGAHLREAVRTGRFCRYAPAEPVVWRVRQN